MAELVWQLRKGPEGAPYAFAAFNKAEKRTNFFDAAEALRIGLVQQVVPHGGQVDAAIAIAERIAAQAPLAVQATMANARLALHDPQAAADRLRRLVAMLAGTQDAQSAMTAFLSGRPIDFEGR